MQVKSYILIVNFVKQNDISCDVKHFDLYKYLTYTLCIMRFEVNKVFSHLNWVSDHHTNASTASPITFQTLTQTILIPKITPFILILIILFLSNWIVTIFFFDNPKCYLYFMDTIFMVISMVPFHVLHRVMILMPLVFNFLAHDFSRLYQWYPPMSSTG